MIHFKKCLIFIFGFALFFSASPNFASHIEEEVRKINSTISIISSTRYQEKVKPRLFVKMIYPILISETEPNPIVDFFNQQVDSIIDTEIQSFKKTLTPSTDKSQNRLFIDYSCIILTIKNNPILSIRFIFQELPLNQKEKTQIQVLNYDLMTGQLIQFNDLFHPDTNLLNLLSNDIQNKMIKRFGGENAIAANLTQIDHFKNFSLHPKGIIFHFFPGEIAKPNYGVQSAFIPYSKIKDFLSEDSLIVYCANHPKSCSRTAILRGGFIEG